MRRINRDTMLVPSPKGSQPYRNPYKAAIRRMRAAGMNRQAKTLARLVQDAAREVRDLTKPDESGKVEP